MPVLVVAVVSANYRNRQQSSCKRQESPIEKLLQAKLLRKPLFILQLLFSLLLLVCLYEMKHNSRLAAAKKEKESNVKQILMVLLPLKKDYKMLIKLHKI